MEQQHDKRGWIGRAGRAAGRQFIPNVGTLLLVALLLWAQQAGAFSFGGPARPQGAAPPNALPATITYQGKLTDAGGAPVTGNVDMAFALYAVPVGGTALWSETQAAVPVQEGEFTVRLGSVNPIPGTVWETSPLYLGIRVGSDGEMAPREVISAVPAALTVPDGAITAAKLDLTQGSIGIGTSVPEYPLHIKKNWAILGLDTNATGQDAGIRILENGGVKWHIFNNASAGNQLVIGPDGGSGVTVLQNGSVGLGVWGAAFDRGWGNYPSITFPNTQELRIHAVGNPAASLRVDGIVYAAAFQPGAIIEANLMTEQEQEVQAIPRFSQGDVLCWDASAGRLEKCACLASPLVIAVADTNGKPVVLGVEWVKVIGPVQPGDLLVASAVPGYAVAWSQVSTGSPPVGLVIAKSLEGFDGGQGMIKAMIQGH